MSDAKLTPPLHIILAHWEEWVRRSAVSPRITSLNVRSLSIPEEIDELLNRNPKSRWQSWKHGAGWSVTGVDYATGEQIYSGAQFKPDIEVQRVEDGKPKFKKDGSPDINKYFNAFSEESCPLFLDTGEPDYWLKILNNPAIMLLITEGAKKAGAALSADRACISIPGVGGQKKGRLKKEIKAFCQQGRVIVLAFDSDQFDNVNVCRELDRLGRLICKEGAVVMVLMLPREFKAIDDYIAAHGYEAFRELVDQAITFEEWRELFIKREIQQVTSPMDFIPDVGQVYQLKAQEALFSDRPWISIDKDLYCWTGTHYQLQETAVIERRIVDWCAATPVCSKDGEWRYSYATATTVNNIHEWVLKAFSVPPSAVNPPGLNCLNGVVKISWQGKQPKWELVKHDPSVIYTYVGEFEYNPDADATVCDRLLQCLDEPQRDIFIKTMAASLDLGTIRSFKGRAIKALLCKGDGNNGKDSLREAIFWLYGVGVVDCPIEDFALYQQGKKYYLAKLEHARVSWSSENANLTQLDNNQALKKVITGESIDIERKFQIDYPLKPTTVLLFNINNVPNLQASMEAIKSRYAVLSFEKTFKAGADPNKGELEADSRFRYDPEFIRKEVVPSLLNKMLAALPEVAMNGIDYSCTDEALEAIQEQTDHLWQFVREVGLHYQPGGRVYIGELWQKLEQWYLDNGTLVISTGEKGKQKRDWHDQLRRADKNVKGSNQIVARFSQLFPKIKKEQDNSTPGKRGESYLSGLSFGGDVDSKIFKPTVNQIFALIRELSPEDQLAVIKAIQSSNEVAQLLRTASQACDINVIASPTASQNPSTASQSVSNSDSPVTLGDSSQSLLSLGIARDNTVDNSTKNFSASTNVPDFKVGDKCKAKHPKVFQLPENKELTITKIEGDKATVTFLGCRSISGVDVELWELCKL